MAVNVDWKQESNGYLVKGMALSVVLAMFLLLVTPRVDTKAEEDVVDNSSEVSEHFEFEEQVEEETVEEEEIQEEEEEQVIDPNVEVEINFDEMDLMSLEQATVVKTVKSTDAPVFNDLSFSNVDQESLNKPYVIHEEMPKPIKQVRPVFPDIAKQNNVSGTVLMEVWVKEDGTVGNVRVVTSVQNIPGGLDDCAVKAVWQWTFEPAKSGGKPIACWVKIPVVMKLEE